MPNVGLGNCGRTAEQVERKLTSQLLLLNAQINRENSKQITICNYGFLARG